MTALYKVELWSGSRFPFMAVCFAVSVWKQSGLCLYLWFLTCSPSVRIMSFNRVVCLVAWLPLHSIPLLLSSCFDLSHFFPHCPQTALLLGNSSLAGCLQLLLQSQDCSMYRSILFQGCGLLLFLPLRKLSLVSQHCVLYISTSNYSFPEHPTKKNIVYEVWLCQNPWVFCYMGLLIMQLAIYIELAGAGADLPKLMNPMTLLRCLHCCAASKQDAKALFIRSFSLEFFS